MRPLMDAPNDSDPIVPSALREALTALYRDLDAAVASAGPACALSGRCCRFAEYGHTLFVSVPEMMLLLAEAPAPVRPLDDGVSCPWQDEGGRCNAREARPLGCRVYYCDESYQETSHALSETFLARLKRLTADLGLPWGYAAFHSHLRRAQDEGRLHGLPERPLEIGPADRRMALDFSS